MLLKFYGYYKQATNGNCNTGKPSIFKVVERAKWDAWNSLQNLSKEEAMQGYIDQIKNVRNFNYSPFLEIVFLNKNRSLLNN